MAELREISEKEIKWHRYLSRKLYLHDQATQQEALADTQLQLQQAKQALDEKDFKLDETQQALSSLKLKSEQREAELLKQIAELNAKSAKNTKSTKNS